jgi:hypothetical protein
LALTTAITADFGVVGEQRGVVGHRREVDLGACGVGAAVASSDMGPMVAPRSAWQGADRDTLSDETTVGCPKGHKIVRVVDDPGSDHVFMR